MTRRESTRGRTSWRGWLGGGLAGLGLLLGLAPAAALEIKPEVVQGRYRDVLRQLSGGEEEAALEALFDLETKALGKYPGTIEIERYWRLKLRVIRELLDVGQVEQLVPIILFHHDAYSMYRDRKEPLLAAHSRTMSAELAEILAGRSESDALDGFAAWTMTSLGSLLLDSRSVSSSMEMFQRALLIAPENQSALLGMVAALEKNGRYEEAVGFGERAVRADAGNHHARLRLAACQRRVGALAEAERNLAVLIEPGPRPWIRSIAFQELADLNFEAGRAERGEELLRRALDELPDDQQVRVMLAAYLDLDRRPVQARRVLDGVRPAPPEVDSARYTYSQWPVDGLPEGRQTLRDMMESRLTQLGRGLSRTPGSGVGR